MITWEFVSFSTFMCFLVEPITYIAILIRADNIHSLLQDVDEVSIYLLSEESMEHSN